MFTIFGIIGLLAASIALWLKNERKQDFLFVVAGILLLIYSISIKDSIFIALQIVFIVSALFEIFKLRKTDKP